MDHFLIGTFATGTIQPRGRPLSILGASTTLHVLRTLLVYSVVARAPSMQCMATGRQNLTFQRVSISEHTCCRKRSTCWARSRSDRPKEASSAAPVLKPPPSVLSAAPTNSRGESTQATRCLRHGCSRSPQSLIGCPPALSAPHNPMSHHSHCGL